MDIDGTTLLTEDGREGVRRLKHRGADSERAGETEHRTTQVARPTNRLVSAIEVIDESEGAAGMKRNPRAGVEDRWTKTVRDEHGNTQKVPSARHGNGHALDGTIVDDDGREQTKKL